MGCTSSTEVIIDPATGQPKKKKTLGGAYPGQRTPIHAPYAPPPGDFSKPYGETATVTSTATAHFIQYGGGNALVLGTNPQAVPQAGTPQPLFVSVTLPPGVSPGDTIHVKAPDGRLNAITVPPGFVTGDSFTVEFVAAPPLKEEPAPFVAATTAPTAAPSLYNAGDDGFAAGFNNPGFIPAKASATTQDTDIDLTDQQEFHHYYNNNNNPGAYSKY